MDSVTLAELPGEVGRRAPPRWTESVGQSVSLTANVSQRPNLSPVLSPVISAHLNDSTVLVL